jgi:SAM-dependent methyltransferase
VPNSEPYYRPDLALIHDRGFSVHAATCASGVLGLLRPVLDAGGKVLEIGCGSGLLTTHLIAAGHDVVATDASSAMLDLAREALPEADLRLLTLPDDPLPPADAIVGIGHALNYLDTEDEVHRSFVAMAAALRPGGVLAVDLCDLRWGELRRQQPKGAWVDDEWALIARFSLPRPELYVREMTTFVRDQDGGWRRDDEVHRNVLVDASRVPGLLAQHGVDASIEPAFGTEELPGGLVVVTGRKASG